MSPRTLPAAFDEQVLRTPDAVALVHAGRALSYRELQDEAQGIAAALLRRGIRAEEPVGVLAGRTPRMVAALLGVAKAGGCYVPIDPSLPPARRHFIAEDTAMTCVLCDTAESTEGLHGRCVLPLPPRNAAMPPAWPAVSPGQLACVMYTSGSTGSPKGVMVPHGAVVNLARDNDFVPLAAGDRLLLTGAIGFDQTTFEVWGALLNGLALHLADTPSLLDAALLRQTLESERITTLLLTSALFNRLAAQDPRTFATLSTLMVGGDVLHPGHCRAVRRACPRLRLVNVYGPTENTTFSTTHTVVEDHPLAVPIGRPLRGCFAEVVDAQGRPIHDGRTGELVVGGANLARGYLNQPQLTAARFVSLPGLGRVYRTGDLARRLGSGDLVYAGREDRQVKIAGYRVELGEVEAAIAAVPGVQDCAAKACERQGERLVAAYYAGGDAAPSPEALRRSVAQRLPAYMVPTFFHRLDSLPLDTRGKLDGAALPDPFAIAEASGPWPSAAPAPASLPQRIREAWEDVLQCPATAADDDFYALGGNSIKAVHLMGRLSALGLEVSLSDILHHRTLSALTRYLQPEPEAREVHREQEVPHPLPAASGPPVHSVLDEAAMQALVARAVADYRRNDARLKQGALRERCPLSPIQQLQIRFDTPPSVGHFLFEGHLDAAALAQAFAQFAGEQTLMHSIAAAIDGGRFEWHELEPPASPGLQPSVLDLAAHCPDEPQLAALATRLVQGLRFERGDLMYHVIVLSINAREHVFILAFHHVLFDRASQELVRRELLGRCRAALAGRPPPTAPRPSFADYVRRLREGPLGIDEAGLVERYRLIAFRAAKRRLLDSPLLRRMDESHAFEIAVPWPGHLQGGRSLGGALALYVKAVAEVFDAGTLPLLFVHDGRKLGGQDHYHVLGEFIDYMPLVLDAGMDALAMQQAADERIALLDRCRINFLALVLEPEAAQRWPLVRELVDPGESLARIDVCMFNYMGNSPAPGSCLDRVDPALRVTPNPLPMHSFLNCIVVSHADGLVYQLRSSIDPRAAQLREAFAALAPSVLA